MSDLTEHLTIDYWPSVVAVSGLVTDDHTGFSWLETVKMSGYYCDEDECPDDPMDECPLHHAGYWEEVMREAWLESITSRGMRMVEA